MTALDGDTTVFLETASPYGEGAAFELSGGGVAGTETGVSDPSQTAYFRLSPFAALASAGAYATESDMVTAMIGGIGAPGTVAAALTYHLAKGQRSRSARRSGTGRRRAGERLTAGRVHDDVVRACERTDSSRFSVSAPSCRGVDTVLM